ncbi:phage virion morphogenesis protein [Deinococcus lacus]|uniref:Phage virion morphogenesis protein n=1 Tax=Deinococcus lacus TaxID=392561 RepID=A0ABW1YDM0_9DEIO
MSLRNMTRLQQQLRDLADPQTLHDLHNLAGREVHAQIQADFTAQQAPDGSYWQPSRAAQREGRRTLRDSGALQDGITWKADSRGVVIQTTGRANRYAGFHQHGTRRLPKRQFMPEGSELPARYEARLVNVFEGYFRSRYGS